MSESTSVWAQPTILTLHTTGMAVLAVSARDGEMEYAIQSTASTGWCPVCGAAARLHGRHPTWVRDLPAGDRPVTLVWVKPDLGHGWRVCRPGLL